MRGNVTILKHILLHLEANKIADEKYQGYSGWYSGNRAIFIKRHKDAIGYVKMMIFESLNNKGEE